jgi:hypothetical protein
VSPPNRNGFVLSGSHNLTLESVRREISLEDKTRHGLVKSMLDSPITKNSEVASQALPWLKTHGHLPSTGSIDDAVKVILSRMIIEPKFSAYLVEVLDRWASWTATGKMGVKDFYFVRGSRVLFAQASLMVATLLNLIDGPAKVLLDIQDCAEKWEYIMLG